jgi:hypothetical protein
MAADVDPEDREPGVEPAGQEVHKDPSEKEDTEASDSEEEKSGAPEVAHDKAILELEKTKVLAVLFTSFIIQ